MLFSPENTIFLFCDGASKGNPGHSGIGSVAYLLKDKVEQFSVELLTQLKEEEKLFEISEYIGENTNNYAEYQSLKKGLMQIKERFEELNNLKLIILMDSELVVNQLKGSYKVKNEKLKKIYKEILEILKNFPFWEIYHIPREKNKLADKLANLSLKNKN